MKMRVMAFIALCAVALLAGCHDPQRWQYEAYQPNLTGDIWAPRPDWKAAEDRAKSDWNAALAEMGVTETSQGGRGVTADAEDAGGR